MRHGFHFLFAALSIVSLLGCASYPINAPLERIDTDTGYRLNNRTLGAKNSDDLKACDVHAKVVCTEVNLGEGCYEKVADDCFEKFNVSDSKRPLDLDIYIIHIDFELIDDQARREWFQSIPTKLQLPKEDIDLLINVAPKLINEEPEFYHLVQDLDARIVN